MSTCPQCQDRRYLVDKSEVHAQARVCACNRTCTVCQGTGRQLLDKDGYTYVQPCSCQSVLQRVALFNQAHLPPRASAFALENFVPQCEEQAMAHSAAQAMVQRYRPDAPPKGFAVAGPVGCGKTHLLCAALRYLTLEASVACRYVEISFLFSEIKQGFNLGRSGLDIIMPLAAIPVLAIDEIGKGRGSAFEMDTLDELIARRYNTNRTTLFATNYSFSAETPRGSALRDPLDHDSLLQRQLRNRVGDRIYSRLFEMCHAIEFPAQKVTDHRKRDKASLSTR